MRRPGDFSKETVITLSRRSALICSNPDCGVLTTGPDTEPDSIVNIGEAAHIYACAEGEARHNRSLGISELSSITNGLWLCRNCHKIVDDDELRFPAELLFEWRRQHESAIIQKIGTKNDVIREKLKNENIRAFEKTTYLAQQIILDKPEFWEYRLTAELLRSEMGAIQTKWKDLKRGLYVRKSANIQFEEISDWLRDKMDYASNTIGAFKELLNELNLSWGPPGKPGNENDILRVCRLITLTATNFLEWEEDLRFDRVPDEFNEVKDILQGTAGVQIDEMMRIPIELSKVFENEKPSGLHKIDLVFSLPDSFGGDVGRAIDRGMKDYRRNHF
jgi:hypothetical protein